MPLVETLEVTNITGTTAVCGGHIINEGSGTIVVRGICWSTDISPTVRDNITNDGAGAGQYIDTLTGLQGGTVYYVKAYASNMDGTGYGMAMSFKTFGDGPSISTLPVSNLSVNGVTLNSKINPNYLPTTVKFEYGLTTSYGQTVFADQNPYNGNTNVNVSVAIAGLTNGTTYHYRIVATNSLGNSNSNDQTFTTLGGNPSLTLQPSTNLTFNSVLLNCIINPNYLPTTVQFEYGPTTSYGQTISAGQNPFSGSADINVSVPLSSLSEGTTYHFRIIVTNTHGSITSTDQTFTTLVSVSDYDGNEYGIVIIGTQTWMGGNLKTHHYNDGSEIQLITSGTMWAGLTTGAYCNYGDNSSNSLTYGSLYNWYAVNDSRNICPIGWHVPAKTEWETLISYLGGTTIAGGKLKETGYYHWMNPNAGADNSSNFTGLGGSFRDYNGTFGSLREYGYFWTSTPTDANYSICNRLNSNGANVNPGNNNKIDGFSVRCIKD